MKCPSELFLMVPALGLQMEFRNGANCDIFTLMLTADMLMNVHCPNSINSVNK